MFWFFFLKISIVFFQKCRRNQHQNRSVTSAEMDLFHSEIRRKPGQALEPVSRKYRALDGFGHLGNWNLCVKHVPLSWFCRKLDWCTFEAKPHYFSQWSPLKGPEILSTWPILSHFKSMISSRWWIWEGVKKEAEYHNFTYSWSRPMFTWWINLRDTLDLNVWDVNPTRLFHGICLALLKRIESTTSTSSFGARLPGVDNIHEPSTYMTWYIYWCFIYPTLKQSYISIHSNLQPIKLTVHQTCHERNSKRTALERQLLMRFHMSSVRNRQDHLIILVS